MYKTFSTITDAMDYCRVGGAAYHHTATVRGYRSTCRYKADPQPYAVRDYQGKYGTGYIIEGYNNDRNILGGIMSNKYYQIWYYLK